MRSYSTEPREHLRERRKTKKGADQCGEKRRREEAMESEMMQEDGKLRWEDVRNLKQ